MDALTTVLSRPIEICSECSTGRISEYFKFKKGQKIQDEFLDWTVLARFVWEKQMGLIKKAVGMAKPFFVSLCLFKYQHGIITTDIVPIELDFFNKISQNEC